MSYIMIDIESDGPIPGDFSMISIGAVIVESKLERVFYAQLKPISDNFISKSLSVSGFTREETLSFEDPLNVMNKFEKWILKNSKGKHQFISDNNGFDWQFINWYFHHFTSKNPFGYSSINLGSLYKGMEKDMFINFKHLRKTDHTHNALDDAKGNAEAFLIMKNKLGLKIEF